MRFVDHLSLTLAAVLLTAAVSDAAGVKNGENGGAAVGMAGAFVAVADDPSAVYYNPAAMTQLGSAALSFGVSPLVPRTSFTAGADIPQGTARRELGRGQTAQTVFGVNPIPHFYGVNKVEDSSVAVGIGVYMPFASGLEWEQSWAGRGQSVKTQVAALAVNPNIAWQVTPDLSAAAGFSLMQSALEAKQVLRANIGDPSEDIVVNVGVEGQAYAGNLALLWQMHPNVSFGASYRSAARADMTGAADFSVPNAAYAELFPDQEVKTTFRFPDVLNAGFGLFIGDDVKFDVEAEFARNNVNRELVLAFDRGKPADTLVQKTDWKNTMTYRLGGSYIASSRWDFSAGAAYDESPVPDHTLGPASADADRVIGALGAAYHWRRHVWSLGTQWQHFLRREVTAQSVAAGAPDLQGEYATELYVASLTWTVRLR